MANSDIVFNIAKGKVAWYAGLNGGASDRLVIIPIEATGMEADAALVDYANVSDLLAAANNEQTSMGRKTATSVTVTPDNTNDRSDAAMATVTWASATGNAVGALLVCYDASGSDTDSVLIPLTKHVWPLTPDGTDATATFSVFYRAS